MNAGRMDPAVREAVLAVADAPTDNVSRGDVVTGYLDSGYDDLSEVARSAWVALVEAEITVSSATRAQKFDWFDRVYRNGEEI